MISEWTPAYLSETKLRSRVQQAPRHYLRDACLGLNADSCRCTHEMAVCEGQALPVDLFGLKVEDPLYSVCKGTDIGETRELSFRLGCAHPVIDQSLDDEDQGG